MPLCAAKTANGKRCQRQVSGNSKYCWQHKRNSPKRSPRKFTAEEKDRQGRWCRCVLHVKEKGGPYNPYAVCSSRIKRVTNSCKGFE